ncbi:MAG: cytochrome c-type biogenesis CcmF C-terminal domain-containing protein, partial [Bacteroidota bacterium]
GFSIFLIIKRWRRLPTTPQEVSAYSREFWIFMGAAVLCLMAFQVLVYTSMPVYNQLAKGLGFNLSLAPPTDTYDAYSFPQLVLAIFLAILSGTGQFFWWKKMDGKKLRSELTLPFILSLLLSGLAITIGKITNPAYTVLLIASTYSVVANGKILFSILRSSVKLSGGSITHIGVAFMLIGILFSSGYSEILSTNYTSMVWSKEFPDEVNQNNLLLFVNEPRQMNEYAMIYKGIRQYTKEVGMVDKNELMPTVAPLKVTRKTKDKYDTLTLVNPENSYFEIEYRTQSGKKFTLFPRVQINEAMGMTVYSPDIHRTLHADMYTHIRTFPKPTSEEDWGKPEEIKVPIRGQFFINDYVATLEKLVPIHHIEGTPLKENDVAVKAIINVQGEYKEYLASPIFIIKNQEFVGRIDDHVNDLAFRISIQRILPQENAVIFNLQTTQKDWIILEAVKKPWINLLWLGTMLLTLGFSVAIYRRYSEFVKMRDKGVEV